MASAARSQPGGLVRWLRFRLNAPLLAGGALVAMLALAALAAPLLAPHSPVDAVVRFEGDAMVKAPYPPGTPTMLLGSDLLRRDLLSRLIYGARYTLVVCVVAALARVGIGMALGMLAGWFRRADRAIGVLISASSAVPSLFFALMPLALINLRGRPWLSLLGFVIVLSLTGWAEAAIRCRAAVQELRHRAFIDAAYVVGRTRLGTLWYHVRPNLRDLLLVEFAYAVGAVLLLMAELALLGIVVGGWALDNTAGRTIADPIYSEWGSLLGRGMRERNLGAWLFLAPMSAFVLAILGFHLLAEGLRKRRA